MSKEELQKQLDTTVEILRGLGEDIVKDASEALSAVEKVNIEFIKLNISNLAFTEENHLDERKQKILQDITKTRQNITGLYEKKRISEKQNDQLISELDEQEKYLNGKR